MLIGDQDKLKSRQISVPFFLDKISTHLSWLSQLELILCQARTGLFLASEMLLAHKMISLASTICRR